MPTPAPAASPTILRVRAFAPDAPAGEPAAPTRAELLIYGEIGESWSETSVLARDVVLQLGALPATVTEIHVRINSIGGSVADGLAIYNALVSHPAAVTVTIDGVAASVASLIAMAGKDVRMHPSSLLMIHAPWGAFLGNAADMRQFLDLLDTWAAAMAKGYAAKSGKTEPECLALLSDGADHWFNAEAAIAEGFADTIIDSTDMAAPGDEANAPAEAAAFARGLDRLISRAPLPIAASLRSLSLRGFNMPTPVAPTAGTPEAVAAELARSQAIRASARNWTDRNDVGARVRAEVDRALDDPTCTPEAFGQRVLAILGSAAEPLNGGGCGMDYVGGGASPAGSGGDFVRAASDAIAIRSGVEIERPAHGARDLQSMSLTEIARACLSRSGKSHGFHTPGAMIKGAMSTSDFPLILENTLGKMLRSGFENEPRTHEAWTRFVKVDDFREQKRPILGSAPALLPVLEGAEYTYGSLDEDRAVPYAVGKFGRMVKLTWEALINDDLAAFARMTAALGQAAARAEADKVYAPFADNAGAGPVMQDSVNLFHVDHDNVAASASSLDAAALGAARVLLRRQTAVGGGQLNLVPRFLLVAPEHEQAAEILLAASARAMSQGAEHSLVASWIASLSLVVESRLSDDAAYLLASPAQIDTVERAWLEADNGPVIAEEDGFNTDDRTYKVRHVFGSRWLDWRGAVKIPISG
jgi:ATP-dependent protease ClpP protease subunit